MFYAAIGVLSICESRDNEAECRVRGEFEPQRKHSFVLIFVHGNVFKFRLFPREEQNQFHHKIETGRPLSKSEPKNLRERLRQTANVKFPFTTSSLKYRSSAPNAMPISSNFPLSLNVMITSSAREGHTPMDAKFPLILSPGVNCEYGTIAES